MFGAVLMRVCRNLKILLFSFHSREASSRPSNRNSVLRRNSCRESCFDITIAKLSQSGTCEDSEKTSSNSSDHPYLVSLSCKLRSGIHSRRSNKLSPNLCSRNEFTVFLHSVVLPIPALPWMNIRRGSMLLPLGSFLNAKSSSMVTCFPISLASSSRRASKENDGLSFLACFSSDRSFMARLM